jgi:hypothetical protein
MRVLAAAIGLALVALPHLVAAQGMSLTALAQRTHFHGLVVDPSDTTRLLLATHHGLYAVSEDGLARKVSATSDDFMGLTVHPTDPSILFASGHPERRGNLGFLTSRDGGRTWRQLSEGAALYGPADFHMMDVSKADPNVIYGVYRELQISRDGGRTWDAVDVPPWRMADLAASAKHSGTLYGATEAGLLLSTDGGRSWRKTALAGKPIAALEVMANGGMWAFVLGQGLVHGREGSPDWETISADLGERILVRLAVDPSSADRLYALTQHDELMASTDGGRTWRAFGAR